ncbi:prepilin-type N-terminal cleavage/methylation domain-containing protein [Patescibacteria group bacterium]|nr:prepilin-type N-terminal cleavage/methylation domain-containing protein [Patescibacteria group bacterium]
MNNQKSVSKNKGFTLIELLVVSTIIVILSAIGIVSFIGAGKGARDAKRKSDLETVRQALVLYRSDEGAYPIGGGGTGGYGDAISELLTKNYISSPTPIDPKNDTIYFYGYSSNTITFTLSAAKLEKTGLIYTLTNP